MNYELAKKLKEVGFPSSEDSELTGKSVCIGDWTSPHLSELIEACGDDFCGLLKRLDWLAIGNTKGVHETGSTPEEAVANLWLELNKK